MKQALILAAVVALTWTVAGCGEKPSVTNYKAGHYQGKPDQQPWDNERFKGDKLAWETAIKARNDIQNERTRATPTAKN